MADGVDWSPAFVRAAGLRLRVGRRGAGRPLLLITHPSLIVAGEKDPSVPLRNARLLAARLPDARVHVVAGGGHLFLLDEPEKAIGPIRAFLDED